MKEQIVIETWKWKSCEEPLRNYTGIYSNIKVVLLEEIEIVMRIQILILFTMEMVQAKNLIVLKDVGIKLEGMKEMKRSVFQILMVELKTMLFLIG